MTPEELSARLWRFVVRVGKVVDASGPDSGPMVLHDAPADPIPNFKFSILNSQLPFTGLDHLAIAVPDTEEALKVWPDRAGLRLLYSEVVNGGAVRLTHPDLGNTQLQLVEQLTPPARNSAGQGDWALVFTAKASSPDTTK